MGDIHDGIDFAGILNSVNENSQGKGWEPSTDRSSEGAAAATGGNAWSEEKAENTESADNMQQLDQQIAEHIERYETISQNICKEVENRRTNRMIAKANLLRRQTMTKRLLWIVFLVLCAVVAYFIYTAQFNMLS